jgi:type IV secretory pathway VirB2 component (pilin)
MNWIKERLTERTSLDGAVLIGTGLVILVAGPFAKIAAVIAIVYGFWSIIKEE